MKVRELDLPGVYEIVPRRFGDERGFFSEVHKAVELAEHGIDVDFVQDNHSLSSQRGVLRGLHYQAEPYAQAKLVRVTRGRIYDVAVDVRRGSPHYGRWVGLEISAQAWNQIFVPEGFLHGFVTLEPDCEVLYKVNAPYHGEADGAVAHDDPAIGVDWPVPPAERILSQKDRDAPSLAEAGLDFTYGKPKADGKPKTQGKHE